jgi:hypothetical protein
MPERIRAWLKKTPPQLRRDVKIYAGTEIHRSVQERIVSSSSHTEIVSKPEPVESIPVYRPDPLVCLGPYCLTGW